MYLVFWPQISTSTGISSPCAAVGNESSSSERKHGWIKLLVYTQKLNHFEQTIRIWCLQQIHNSDQR
jgi:hypothetical protein